MFKALLDLYQGFGFDVCLSFDSQLINGRITVLIIFSGKENDFADFPTFLHSFVLSLLFRILYVSILFMQQYLDIIYTGLHSKSLFLPARVLLVLGIFHIKNGRSSWSSWRDIFFPEHFTSINTFSLQVIMRRIYFIVFFNKENLLSDTGFIFHAS